MATSQALAQDYDSDKLRELVVYIAHKSLGDRHFGATKLNKILFFSDFTAYRQTGKSITGAVYQHLAQGPCPQKLLPLLNEMAEEDVTQLSEQVGSFVQKRLVPKRTADLRKFSGTEVAVVDRVLDDLFPMNAKQASDYSHDTIAWRVTADRQEIPYGTALLSGEEPTDADLEWVEEVANSAALDCASQ